MIAWGVALAGALASFVLVFVVVSYERELRSMARFLEKRERGSNERVSVDFSTKGIAGIARAINEELDAHIAQEAHRAAFRQDLASLSHDIRTPLAGRRDICSCTTVRKAKRNGVAVCLRPHRAWQP